MTNNNKPSTLARVNQSSNVNWELIQDSLKDLASSAANNTIAICEQKLLEEYGGDPDEIVRLEIYNNIGAVKDIFEQLQLLGM
jgi:hypothetical protein